MTETIVTVGARLMVKHMALLQLSLCISVYTLTHTPKERTFTDAAVFASTLTEKYAS